MPPAGFEPAIPVSERPRTHDWHPPALRETVSDVCHKYLLRAVLSAIYKSCYRGVGADIRRVVKWASTFRMLADSIVWNSMNWRLFTTLGSRPGTVCTKANVIIETKSEHTSNLFHRRHSKWTYLHQCEALVVRQVEGRSHGELVFSSHTTSTLYSFHRPFHVNTNR